MGEVAELNPRLDKSAYTGNPMVSFVPMPGVEPGTGAIDVSQTRSLEEVKKGYTPFREGDVLFAKITPCMENGKMAVVPALKNDLGFGSTEFHVLRPYLELSAKYIYFFVSSEAFRRDAEHNMTVAVGQRRVPTSYLIDQSIPVPPVREQRRIAAKIEELFSELHTGIASLKTARAKLDAYRQALLKHAFEGKLTARWRGENRDKLEQPEQLLDRIKQEQKVRYDQELNAWRAAVKQWEENNKSEKKPQSPKKAHELNALSSDEFPALPEGWRWFSLSAITSNIQIGPFGSLLHKADYLVGGTPLVNPSHIRYQRIEPDRNLTVSAQKLRQLSKYVLHKNDIVIGRRGQMGRCAVVTEAEAGWLCGTGSLFVRLLSSMNSRFYSWVLGSQRVKDFLSASSIGTTMQNLNERILHHVPVPICSRHEQDETVREIERQYSMLDLVEAAIDAEFTKSATIRQAILKKAYSGQLLAQDPNDEPASVLLERIRAEREKTVKNNRPRKAKKRRTSASTPLASSPKSGTSAPPSATTG